MPRDAFVRLSFLLVVGLTGCGSRAGHKSANRFVKQARVDISPEVLDAYVGDYRLPSGVLFRVRREEKRLVAGEPPSELLPQTTRQFASNRILAEIIFDRSDRGLARRVNLRAAKQDMWAQRVDSADADDPTQMVDVGEHRLRMLVTGEGGPTIVVEDGFGSSILLRAKLQAELSKFARVVTYDHAGTGGSETGPEPRHAAQVADELRTALRNAEIDPPFVMVGGSIGADYISVFAHKFSQDVAGLVRLDPTPDWEALDAWMKVNASSRVDSFRQTLEGGLGSIPEFMKLQEAGRRAEWDALALTEQQARDALPLADIPIVQITGAAGQETSHGARDKVEFFDAWLHQHMPQAKHVLAGKSGHAVFAAEPQLVIREIRTLLRNLRRGPVESSRPVGK